MGERDDREREEWLALENTFAQTFLAETGKRMGTARLLYISGCLPSLSSRITLIPMKKLLFYITSYNSKNLHLENWFLWSLPQFALSVWLRAMRFFL